jgi:hypothetical protein
VHTLGRLTRSRSSRCAARGQRRAAGPGQGGALASCTRSGPAQWASGGVPSARPPLRPGRAPPPQDQSTGMGAGYGFVKYQDRRCAAMALQYLNVRGWAFAWPGGARSRARALAGRALRGAGACRVGACGAGRARARRARRPRGPPARPVHPFARLKPFSPPFRTTPTPPHPTPPHATPRHPTPPHPTPPPPPPHPTPPPPPPPPTPPHPTPPHPTPTPPHPNRTRCCLARRCA